MSDRPNEDPRTPEEATFVRRLAEAYVPPPSGATRRARFDARLAERIDRAGNRRPVWLAAAVAAGAAALLLVSRLASGPEPAPDLRADAAGPEVLLADVLVEPTGDFEASLPDDYRAIASLLEEL